MVVLLKATRDNHPKPTKEVHNQVHSPNTKEHPNIKDRLTTKAGHPKQLSTHTPKNRNPSAESLY
jgi:hypothetical protein